MEGLISMGLPRLFSYQGRKVMSYHIVPHKRSDSLSYKNLISIGFKVEVKLSSVDLILVEIESNC